MTAGRVYRNSLKELNSIWSPFYARNAIQAFDNGSAFGHALAYARR